MIKRSCFGLALALGVLACGAASGGSNSGRTVGDTTGDDDASDPKTQGKADAGDDATTDNGDDDDSGSSPPPDDDAGGGHPDAGGTGNGHDAGAGGSDAGGGGTSLTGTIGSLGAAQPTVSAIAITNGPEVIVYLSSAPLQCSDIQASRWLSKLPSSAQVVEIVVPSGMTTGTVHVAAFGGAEVNYAAGGKSSSYEKSAASGSVTFTSCAVSAPCSGTVMATYANPAGSVSGTFHAEFCQGGQEY